jgi:cysteine dioxygenase
MTETLVNINTNINTNDIESMRMKYLNKTAHLSTQPNSLNELIDLIYQAFETNEVDIDYVNTIMANYKGNMKEWAPFTKFQPNKYTRNLVDTGNGKFNLIILCWAESQGSSIHNHQNSHCFMKCIQGTLVETQYAWPNKEDDNKEQPMQVIKRTEIKEGEVTYINDSIGLHRVENPSHTDTAMTLHLYVPPYSHCNTYDERTSRINEAFVTFYSVKGKLTVDE